MDRIANQSIVTGRGRGLGVEESVITRRQAEKEGEEDDGVYFGISLKLNFFPLYVSPFHLTRHNKRGRSERRNEKKEGISPILRRRCGCGWRRSHFPPTIDRRRVRDVHKMATRVKGGDIRGTFLPPLKLDRTWACSREMEL
jgi:hypothetical protein